VKLPLGSDLVGQISAMTSSSQLGGGLEKHMRSITVLALGITAFLSVESAIPIAANAQTARDLVGSWEVVSVDNVSSDGRRTPAFGANPKGVVMFDDNGHYVELILRSDLPNIAGASRMQGTPEENKAVAQGVLAFYGPYSVIDKIVTLNVESSSYPNWTGGNQQRMVTSFTTDEMKWTNSTGSSGGLVELVARRVK
jgi:hypothetical protein